MKQLIEDLISAMEYHVEQTRPIHSTTVALQAAREALRAQPEPVQEPVAWNKKIRDSVDSLLAQAGFDSDSSVRHQLAMMNFDANPASMLPEKWRNVLPGGRGTDQWESARVADFNKGWNEYRKAAKAALEKLEVTPPAAQRQWVGLTPHERMMCRSYDIDEAIANTEAKLKEKNT